MLHIVLAEFFQPNSITTIVENMAALSSGGLYCPQSHVAR
jgi:hypothetical protein